MFTLFLISSRLGTFLPSRLSKAIIEFTLVLLELRFMLYLKVPDPSRFNFISSMISMHELNKKVIEKRIQNFFVIILYVRFLCQKKTLIEKGFNFFQKFQTSCSKSLILSLIFFDSYNASAPNLYCSIDLSNPLLSL